MKHVQPQAEIPLARGGDITDATLAEMIDLSDQAALGALSHEGATLLLQNIPGALRELHKRRQVSQLIHQCTAPDNVVRLVPTDPT